MGQIQGRKTATAPRCPHYEACLYASLFLHASITIMATVCPFFPSQLTGETSVGPGDCQIALSLPNHLQRQKRLSITYFTGEYVHLTCSKPVFSSIQKLDPRRFKRPAPPTHIIFTFALAR